MRIRNSTLLHLRGLKGGKRVRTRKSAKKKGEKELSTALPGNFNKKNGKKT